MAPAYRSLERATDAAEMKQFFASHLGRLDGQAEVVEACHVPRVFPFGQAFVVQYELWLRRHGARESARLLACGLLDTESDHGDLAAGSGYDMKRCVSHPEIGLAVPVFPYDPGLPTLATTWDDERTRELLRRYAAGPAGGAQCDSPVTRTVMGYRLGRRCTMILAEHGPGLDSPSRQVVVKIVPPRKAARFVQTLDRLREAGLSGECTDGLTVPSALGADPDAGVIVMERAPGESLHQLAGTAHFAAAAAAAGRVLRRLHGLGDALGDAPLHSAVSEMLELVARTDRVCVVFPSCAHVLSEVRELLRARLASGLEPAAARPVHRDFYDKQVLYQAGRTTLLDLDSLASGDPAQDVGNFLAHLELRSLQNPALEPGLAGAAVAFLDAYGDSNARPPDNVSWWQAATLLRLAGLYALRPRWRHLTLELALRARRHLDLAAPVFIRNTEVT